MSFRVETIRLISIAPTAFVERHVMVSLGSDRHYRQSVNLANVSNEAKHTSSSESVISPSNDLSGKPLLSHNTLFWVSLFGTIANALGTISTVLLAWMSNKRLERELFLKKMEAAQKEREMAFKEHLANLEMRERELKIMQLEHQMAV